MANCMNCGAPLPAGSAVCGYCHTRSDVDLRGIHKYTVEEPESRRTCPRCNISLQSLDLKISGRFLIEKCPECYGLFFDPGELEALLEKSVANVFDINYKQIEDIKNQRRHDDYPVKYIKCPVCGKLMHRVNFGSRSGVIVDKCKEDGVWLDGGELRRLMEWMKAGGQLLHHQKYMEEEKLKLQQEKRKIRDKANQSAALGLDSAAGYDGRRGFATLTEEPDLFGLVTRFISKITF